MIGGLGPDDPDESRNPEQDRPEGESRRERDTEPIPRTRGEAQLPEDETADDAQPHFVGTAAVGAGGRNGGGRHGNGGPSSYDDGGGEYRDEPPHFTEEELSGLQFDDEGVPLGPRRVLPMEDEPSRLVAKYLFPTERYRGEWKRHWIHHATHLGIGVLATFVLGYLSGVLVKYNQPGFWALSLIVWAGIMGWIAWKIADWYFDRFILTNKRLMLVNGIITRRVAMMPLIKVTDMKYEQSPVGRMFNYGTFVLESAGQDQALSRIEHMPNPNELYLRIVEEMYEPAAVEARLGREPDEE